MKIIGNNVCEYLEKGPLLISVMAITCYYSGHGVSSHQWKPKIKTEVGTKDLGVAVIDLTVVLLGRIWTLGLLGLWMKAILVGG